MVLFTTAMYTGIRWHLVDLLCVGAKLFKSFVKRKAGVNPALSRSGDGNERSQWREPTHCLFEMGSGDRVGRPKSEGRPATTTMEAIAR